MGGAIQGKLYARSPEELQRGYTLGYISTSAVHR